MLQLKKTSEISNIHESYSLINMIGGYWITQMIYVAAKLGLADLLKDGSKSSDDLAKSLGVDTRSLYRLLRALSSVGIFAEEDQNQFKLTPMAELLQVGIQGSLRGAALMHGSEWQWGPWGQLFESVKTGRTQFESVFDVPIYDYLSQNTEAYEIFNSAMTSFSYWEDCLTLSSYEFSSIHQLVDVGGGQGNLLTSILEVNPTMKGVLFDVPQVIESAKHYVKTKGLTGRCETISGNFFESVPANGDTYLLKRVVHGWDDESAVALLKNCHRAMPNDAKLLVVEMVVQPGNEPFFGKVADLQMMVQRGGHERTDAEYRNLLDIAGFEMKTIIPTASYLSFIEATPYS